MGKEKANAILREILTGRGIAGEAAVAEFLSPRPRLTHDPLLLPDMEAGADFLLSAAREGRRICIYGDYDADGVLGTALLWLFLKELGGDVSYYIPSRTFEGYGLNTGALQKLRDQGAEVVVTVDCGSVSVDEVSFAKSIGLEIMIT
ncbi:MAG: DHH family phosphoesterase, partial [Clostridiales Family XIII bacterium]|nr:DHH family phosphoesterase [Clostridiales Family XIII bacterium]